MKNLKVLCNNCRKITNHDLLFTKSIDDIEDLEGQSYLLSSTDYSLVQCRGCEAITYITTDNYPNFLDIGPSGNAFISSKKSFSRFYPERVIELKEEKKFAGIPSNLKLIYREIIDGFNLGQRILCAAGLRSIIEGTCRYLEIIDGNLHNKIQSLSSTGQINKTLADALDVHKFLGNKALHELAVPSKEELIHAIELVEQMLEQIFNVPDKSERLKALVTKRISNK